MSPEFYKVIHLIGLICLFTGIGGFLTYGFDHAPRVKMVGILHGVGLLLLLVSGFGMTAKLGVGFPVWVILKLVLWLVLGALLAFAKKGRLAPRNAVIIGLAIGFVAAYIGLTWKYGFSLPSAGTAAPAQEQQG
ncbi:MAG: hypothetical protein KDM64_07735 [Verrucomicrobiae bacterium]|nr:hypothetical protein [Verrucomicrobiae bacterium]